MMGSEDLTVVLDSKCSILENAARYTFASSSILKAAMLLEQVSSAVLPSPKVVVYSL